VVWERLEQTLEFDWPRVVAVEEQWADVTGLRKEYLISSTVGSTPPSLSPDLTSSKDDSRM
jgi:hypothetical protein